MAIAICVLLLFAISFKNVKERIVGRAKTIKRAIEKRSQKQRFKLSKEIKSDNFCYHIVGRVITKWGAIEKSPILNNHNLNLSNKLLFNTGNKRYSRIELK